MTGGNFQSSVFVGKKFRLAKVLLADPFESACLKRAEYLQPFMIMVSDEPDSKTRELMQKPSGESVLIKTHRHRGLPAGCF